MPEQNTQTINTRTTTTSNFDERADKWWESRWAFIMAIVIPMLAVTGVWSELKISDQKQMDAIKADQAEHENLTAQLSLFMNGDFKDAVNIIKNNQDNIVDLKVEVVKLETLINERIPAKKQ